MIGRRIPDGESWHPDDRQPGDYGFVSLEGTGRFLWIVDPNGNPGMLRTHTVIEHEDGTVTVSPSILDQDPGGWHGWLERGVWRAA